MQQVLHALWPRLSQPDLASVPDVLTDELAALFFGMEKRDQRHALEVARRLRESGVADPDLLVAALLHDCGKGAVPISLRILKVAFPSVLHRMADEGSPGSRGAAFRLLEHAEIGARMAEARGASTLTVRLIRERVLPHEQQNLALLHAADDAS